MKTIALLFATLSVLSPLAAQNVDLPVVRPPEYDAVRQFLVLSEAQVASLTNLQKSRQEAEMAIYAQIRQRRVQLSQLLESGSNDSVTIGRLMVEINNLQRQIPSAGAPFRTSALAVLDDAQKGKLAQLTQALELQVTAGEAVSLNLIDHPRVPQRILPAPVEVFSANVVSKR